MSFQITKQGLLDTFQDGGRYGYQHNGINVCGAMDNIAAKLANMLVGNEVNEAVIELHFPASSFYIEKACMIAVSGADFGAALHGQPVPLHTAIIVAAASTLDFKRYKKGARCYIAVQGGWDIAGWLGSYSTHLKVHAGGFKGRALKKNDVLHIRAENFVFAKLPHGSFIVTPVAASVEKLYSSAGMIRCIKGNEYRLLDDNSIQTFQSAFFKISVQSDRMGYRLNGPLLASSQKQIISAAVTKGTIQLLPNGQLIVLMADHQTTGGYLRIAHVITADMPLLAQMQPNTSARFSLITLQEAEELYVLQQQYLLQLQDDCNLQLKQFLSANANR